MPDRPLDTVDDTLQNPELTAAFRNHLVTEFSSENMDFHEVVTQFSKDAGNPAVTDDQLRASARQIVDQYIRPGSDKQVNVSSAQVDMVNQAMAGIGGASRAQIGSVLDESHTEVVALMGRDPFTRFKKTSAYADARDQVNLTLDHQAEQLQQLQQLQTRERQLKLNPSMADKAKAMVTSGGMVTLIREVERQREAMEQQIQQRAQQRPVVVQLTPILAPQLPRVEPPPLAPLDLEPGVVSRSRGNVVDGPAPHKASVREQLGEKGALKVGEGSAVSVSTTEHDPSKQSVKDKIKLFEKGGATPPTVKRGVS